MLAGALAELRGAAAALGTIPVLDGAATKEAFLRGAADADIVYVAGHAVSSVVPAHAALVMSGDAGGALLPVDEIRRSRLRSRLVVLAACGTAAAQGEGVTSLVRAFLVAGAPAVTGSLVSVGDAATQRLLTPFTRELAAGRPPCDALRRVQQNALAADRSADPLSWAGFQLYGSASLPL
jgi:CHAT domain-containing protein